MTQSQFWRNLKAYNIINRLPTMDWFIDFCMHLRLNRRETTFVLRYLSALIDGEGHPWAMHATHEVLREHALKAVDIAKNPVYSDILVPLTNVLTYYPLQINGLTDFVNDFQRLLAQETRLPQEILDEPQRLAIAQAIFQANFFKETPIREDEIEEIRAMDIARFSPTNLANIHLPQFWNTHRECSHLFTYILCRNSHPSIASCEKKPSSLSPEFSSNLFHAANAGGINAAKAALRIPTLNVNGKNPEGVTTLFIACRQGRDEIIQLLMQDPRTDINLAATDNTTPLGIACFLGHIDSVRILLTDRRIDINRANNKGATPLLLASSRGHTKIVEMLLADCRLKPTIERDTGANSLTIACQYGHLEIVRLFLKDGRIDINHPCHDGTTALYHACRKKHNAIVELLLKEKRINVNIQGDLTPPFYEACISDLEIDTLKLFLKKADIQLEMEQPKFLDVLNKLPEHILEFIVATSVKNPVIHTLLTQTAEAASREHTSPACKVLLDTFSKASKEDAQAVAAIRRAFEKYFAAAPEEVFAFTVLFCDNLLTISCMNMSEPCIKSRRFFRIAAQLPMDLQMVLANRLQHLGDILTTQNTDKGLKSVVRLYHT